MSKKSQNGVDTKKVGSFLALLSFTAYMPISCTSAFAVDMNMPNLNNAINGNVTDAAGNVIKAGQDNSNLNKINVNVQGGKGTVGQFDWNSFNVAKGNTVNFTFSANGQTSLNRVLNTGGMSYIYGKLTESAATGCASCVNTSKVILINPNGVMMGPGSTIDLNSFTASTFDIKGIKNIKDMTVAERAAANDLNADGTFKGLGTLSKLAGYNTSVQFVPSGNGDGVITANGALFNTDATGEKATQHSTVALVGNNINVTGGTQIKTKYESAPPNAQNNTQTRSGVKIVTGDGVNFVYTTSGNIYSSAVKQSSTSKGTGIKIADSAVRTGSLEINNGSGDKVDISNSKLYSKKLLGSNNSVGLDTDADGNVKYDAQGNPVYRTLTAEESGEYGNIAINSRKSVNITNSNVQTTDDYDPATLSSTGEKVAITSDMTGGRITIAAGEDVNVKDSTVRSVNNSTTYGDGTSAGNMAGNILVEAGGNINLTTSSDKAIVSGGDMTLTAGNKIDVKGYKVQAKGDTAVKTTSKKAFTSARTLNMNANTVNIDSSLVNANTINVADGNGVVTKNINIKDSEVVATTKLNLLGNDTTIDNSLVQYKDVAFFNGNSKVNNVTLKNNTTMNDKDSDGLVVTTNGNLTVDNTALNKKAYGSTSSSKQKFVKLTSTKGNVNIQNGASVYGNGGGVDIAANGNVKVTGNTEVWAKDSNVNITATNGRLTMKGDGEGARARVAAEGGTTTVKQNLDMNLSDKNQFNYSILGGSGSTTDKTKLVLKSNGTVKGANLINDAVDIGSYKNVPALSNTDNHAIFTLSRDAKIIGKNIDLAGKSDLNLTNLTTDSTDGTKIAAAGKLNLNDLNIANGPTTLEGSEIKTPNGKINANNNKVILNSPGEIDINISGASNPKNGLEVNSKINTGIHNGNKYGQDELIGRNVKINAGNETLAISKIKADELTVKAKDIVKGDTDITNEWDNLGYVDKNGNTVQEIGDSNNAKGYIEVRSDGKFNLDPSTTYNASNSGMYTGGNYSTTTNTTVTKSGSEYTKATDVDTQVEVTRGTKDVGDPIVTRGNEISRGEVSRTPSGDPVVTKERQDNVYQDGKKGYTITTTTVQEYDVVDEVVYNTVTTQNYVDTETTKTTTTTTNTTYQNYKTTTDTRDKQHVATLNDNQKDAFVLVYGKNTSKSETAPKIVKQTKDVDVDVKTVELPGVKTREVQVPNPRLDKEQITRKDVVTKTTETFCEYEDVLPANPDIDPSTMVRLPRHAEGISNSAPVQNDLADTTSTVVAAAARLQLDDQDEEVDMDY